VRGKQPSQTAQSALALRVVPLFRLSGVARRLQIAADMLPPRALERRKIGNNTAWLNFSTGYQNFQIPKLKSQTNFKLEISNTKKTDEPR
jgi:hypothetical protein